MIEELLKEIQKGNQVRQNLSQLRQYIKEADYFEKASELLKDEVLLESIVGLLQHEDGKTRKNAALFMGDMAFPIFLEPLFLAYLKEEQLFVRSSYLQAMKAFDYRDYLPKIKEQLERLSNTELTEENKKHIGEEMRGLSDLIVAMDGIKAHEFRGFHELSEIILLTNRKHNQVTLDQITQDHGELLPVGVRLTTNNLDKIIPIRTYQELLFVVPNMKICEMDPIQAAEKIAGSGIVSFMEKRHKGKVPFYFRIELKSKMELSKKSQFVKKMSMELERLTERNLINSPSSYEFEIRLIENKEHKCNILIKLLTIPDDRFTYRKEALATSIKPVNAALLVELAKEYMVEDAQVLDPFCGAGTMLIERQKVVKANTSYGIDCQEAAIKAAKINTQAASQIIHYVHKDFFEFTHEYLFDEIFTNMPFAMGHKSEEEIYELYVRFFDRAKMLLNKTGRIIMYTHNRDYVRRLAKEKGYAILKHIEIMEREETDLFILS